MRAGDGWIGAGLRRCEDARLVTGRGRFVDDLAPEGCLALDFFRSPVAAGRITALHLDAARAAPGVVAVLTGADVAGLGEAAVNRLVPGMRVPPFPILPEREVAAVGQPLVAVVAETLAAARDAAALVEASIQARPLRTPSTETRAVAQTFAAGDVDGAFLPAAHIVRARCRHARLAPAPLEPRAALATWSEADGLTVWLSTQTPHRARTDLAHILDLDPERVRVIAPDVGGAFGGKASIYPEEVLVAVAALRLGRPVRWCATRGDDFLAATHARGGLLEGELALAADGRFLGLKVRIDFPLGHWLPFSGCVPARNAARILPGPYRVEAVAIAMEAHLTDTAPLGIYRGAGRPEAAMLMERLVEAGARATGIDPAELRRRNLLTPDALPHRTPTGERLDSGDFPGLLAEVCTRAEYEVLKAGCARRRAAGEVCGIGLAVYVEPCGQGAESASVRLAADGRILAATGSTAQGQGRETAFAQIVADALKIHPDRVDVLHGDTGTTPPGIGALASRSTAIGGSALLKATRDFRDRAVRLAARRLQTAPERVTTGPEGLADGASRIGWDALAALAEPEDGLCTSVRFEADGEAWASGACLALVRIDAETGEPTIERIVWVDDAGTVVNPLLVEGQLLGGLAQGLGEALMERLVHDADGQLVTGSFMDYRLPRADDMPPVTLAGRPTPSPTNLLGAKGVGEAGCIGVPAAVVNAVLDALAPFGVEHLDMPLTSASIWHAMRTGRRTGGDRP